MKKLVYLFVAGTMVFALTTQCSKKKENPAPSSSSPSKEELLAGTSYKKYTITSDKINGTETISTDYRACEIDDEIHFYKNNNVYFIDAGTKCTSQDTLFATTWNFNSAKDSVFVTGIGGFKILSLSSSSFSYQTEDDNGDPEVLVLTSK